MKLFTQKDVAIQLGITKGQFDYAIRENYIDPPTTGKNGRRLYYTKEQADKVVEQYKSWREHFRTSNRKQEPNRNWHPGLYNVKETAHQAGVRYENFRRTVAIGHITQPTTRIGKSKLMYYTEAQIPQIKEEYRDWRESLWKKPILLGIKCGGCEGRVAEPDRTLCKVCLESRIRHSKMRKQQGLCSSCNNPPMLGRSKCQACANKASQYAKAFHARHQAQGLCVACCEPRVNMQHCARHIAISRETRNRRIRKRFLIKNLKLL